MKRADLVPLAVLGLVGVVLGLALGGDDDDALYLGLGVVVLATLVVLSYRGAQETADWTGAAGGPTFTNRQMVRTMIVGTIVGLLIVVVQLARG